MGHCSNVLGRMKVGDKVKNFSRPGKPSKVGVVRDIRKQVTVYVDFLSGESDYYHIVMLEVISDNEYRTAELLET